MVPLNLFASAAMERRLRLVLMTRRFACGMLKRASASRRLRDIMIPLNSVCFSSDGKKIASGSDDKTVRVWHVETGECIKTFEGHNGSVNSVCFSSDGKKIASGSGDKTVRVWHVETGECAWSGKT